MVAEAQRKVRKRYLWPRAPGKLALVSVVPVSHSLYGPPFSENSRSNVRTPAPASVPDHSIGMFGSATCPVGAVNVTVGAVPSTMKPAEPPEVNVSPYRVADASAVTERSPSPVPRTVHAATPEAFGPSVPRSAVLSAGPGTGVTPGGRPSVTCTDCALRSREGLLTIATTRTSSPERAIPRSTERLTTGFGVASGVICRVAASAYGSAGRPSTVEAAFTLYIVSPAAGERTCSTLSILLRLVLRTAPVAGSICSRSRSVSVSADVPQPGRMQPSARRFQTRVARSPGACGVAR